MPKNLSYMKLKRLNSKNIRAPSMPKFKTSLNVVKYEHRKNKIEPLHPHTIDYYASFIQERVDFTGFSEFTPNDHTNKITRKRIKLNNFFCLCLSIISIVFIALVVTIIFITNKSNLNQSNELSNQISSSVSEKTSISAIRSSTYLTVPNLHQNEWEMNTSYSNLSKSDIYSNLSSASTKILRNSSKTKITSTKKIFSSKFSAQINFAFSLTSDFSYSDTFKNTNLNQINSKISTANLKNDYPTTLFMRQICPDGFSGSNCLDECGLRDEEDKESSEFQWSSLVSIIFNYTFNYRLRDSIYTVNYSNKCTGSLISRDTVLTPASCLIEKVFFQFNGERYVHVVIPNQFFDSFKSMYKIYLVEQNLVKNQVSMLRYIKHPEFEENSKLNDIAIIKLGLNAGQSVNNSLSCLPKQSEPIYPKIDISEAYMIGFNSNSSDALNDDVRITKYKSLECLNVTHIIDWDRQICTIDRNGEKDLCDFDFGSPLLVKQNLNEIDRFILIGILSKKSSCDQASPVGYIAYQNI